MNQQATFAIWVGVMVLFFIIAYIIFRWMTRTWKDIDDDMNPGMYEEEVERTNKKLDNESKYTKAQRRIYENI